MGKIIIVSNRLPITVRRKGKGTQYEASVGGLATGMSSIYKKQDNIWIGWPGVIQETLGGKEKEIRTRLESEKYMPIFLSKEDVKNFYQGFCNGIIWPLFHYFPQHPVYDKKLWNSYKRMNNMFCDEVLKVAESGDTVWIHDYHLMLLPQLIRERLPDAEIGFFLHIPFPAFELFQLLPWRTEILNGLLGSDLIGFHTHDYMNHFLDSIGRLLGYERLFNNIYAEGRVVKADVFPMGIDYGRFSNPQKREEVETELQRMRETVGDRKVIFSIDRLDYSKGILNRLEAFDLFLEKYPNYKEKVTFILVAVPSRTDVEQYQKLKKRLDETVGMILGKYGTVGWMPIWYIGHPISFQVLVALYRLADVSLITPLRDGMNLIAKEFLASKTDGRGVLILSEMAGASRELGEAIIINPNDRDEVADAIRDALSMPIEEQVERNSPMRDRLKRYDVEKWANDFIERLHQTKEARQNYRAKTLSKTAKNQLFEDYAKSKNRLILLDYDGTLVMFQNVPLKAGPDPELIEMLKKLADYPGNEIVVISGRDRKTIGRWLMDVNCCVARFLKINLALANPTRFCPNLRPLTVGMPR
ncbi:MAG: bifunctional alpha,alpha-trehalose-phosphate synthase (UDP-forming)/trehalose-phosphatase, partial [Thermoplasmata archaeon HGW-Thermoplasmata-1]